MYPSDTSHVARDASRMSASFADSAVCSQRTDGICTARHDEHSGLSGLQVAAKRHLWNAARNGAAAVCMSIAGASRHHDRGRDARHAHGEGFECCREPSRNSGREPICDTARVRTCNMLNTVHTDSTCALSSDLTHSDCVAPRSPCLAGFSSTLAWATQSHTSRKSRA
jgi:hypothetical protein